MATKRLSTVSVDYKTMLGKMSVTERLRLAQSQDGPSILANVDPSQLPGLFPRYYLEKLPDVGEALKSVMSDKFKPLSREQADEQMRQSSTAPTPRNFNPETGKKTSYAYSKEKLARLTDDQKNVLEELKKGTLSEDDPRVGFLKNLKDEDLKRAGIDARRDDTTGKLNYSMSEPTVSVDEVTNRLNSSASSALTNDKGRVVSTHDATLKPAERGLLDTIASGESPDYNTITSGGGKFDGYNDHPRKRVRGNGVNSDAAGRYQFLSSTWDGVVKKFNAENPNDPITDFSPRNQDRAALHLAKIDYKRRTGRDLSQDLDSNDPQVRQQMGSLIKQGLGGGQKGPTDTTWQAFQTKGAEHWQNEYDKNLKRNTDYQTARNRPDTPEERSQVEAELKAAKKGQNLTELQKILASQGATNKPETISQTRTEGSGKTYTAGDSIGQGVGGSNKIPSVAQGGLMFTDPRMVQQLKNVPQGSTVQLYAGTNDAASGRLDSKAYEARMAELKQIAEERGLNVSIHGPHQSPNKQWSGNVGTVNQLLGDSARNNGFKYVDNSTATADANDNIHMSNKGYQDLYSRGMQDTTAIPAMAEGGDLNVNEGEIKALPIGAMKNDNSVVVDKDSKPLFTMNTKEESANYNPDTGKVSVDPNAKKENDGNQELSLEQQAQFKQTQVPIPESSGMSSFDTTLTLTDNMFKDPSFHRAMSRARFDISGDSASGNHFSSSATVS